MKKKERNLSLKEQKRKEDFEKITEEMREQGYERREVLISTKKAYTVGILIMIPFVIILVNVFMKMHKCTFSDILDVVLYGEWLTSIMVIFGLIISVPLNSLVYGLTWAPFTKKKMKAISFGFMPAFLSTYCTCDEPLPKKAMILGTTMPIIVTGIVPSIIACISGSHWVLYVAFFIVLGSGTCLMMLFDLLKEKDNNKEKVYLDHPYEPGFVIFERDK